jgi:hypothetical protein
MQTAMPGHETITINLLKSLNKSEGNLKKLEHYCYM